MELSTPMRISRIMMLGSYLVLYVLQWMLALSQLTTLNWFQRNELEGNGSRIFEMLNQARNFH